MSRDEFGRWRNWDHARVCVCGLAFAHRRGFWTRVLASSVLVVYDLLLWHLPLPIQGLYGPLDATALCFLIFRNHLI